MIKGPHGFYTLPRDASRPVIFVAGGIGITAFVSMLRFAAQTDRALPPVTLMYVNRNRKSAAYLEELGELARRSARLPCITTSGSSTRQLFGEASVTSLHLVCARTRCRRDLVRH